MKITNKLYGWITSTCMFGVVFATILHDKAGYPWVTMGISLIFVVIAMVTYLLYREGKKE